MPDSDRQTPVLTAPDPLAFLLKALNRLMEEVRYAVAAEDAQALQQVAAAAHLLHNVPAGIEERQPPNAMVQELRRASHYIPLAEAWLNNYAQFWWGGFPSGDEDDGTADARLQHPASSMLTNAELHDRVLE